MALKIIWNNIIDEPTDVIVTPASRKPRVGTGLDKAIHAAAGEQLLAARKKIGTIEPGVVKETPSFGLAKTKCRAKWVIHALGPWCEGKPNGTERPMLIGCYLQVLCRAVALGAKTVSLPVFSSGKFGMPLALAVDAAVDAIQEFLAAFPDLTVKLVSVSSKFREYAWNNYPDFLESNFTVKSEKDYRARYPKSTREKWVPCGVGLVDGEDSAYFRGIQFVRETEGKDFKRLINELWQSIRTMEKRRRQKNHVRHSEQGDGEYLLTYKDLSTRSGVDIRPIRRYFACSNQTVPPQPALLRLMDAMELSPEYRSVLLKSCGYPI